MSVSSKIVLACGAETTVTLQGLSTAGYIWQHEVNGDTFAVVVEEVLVEQSREQTSGSIKGGTEEVVFRILGIKPGLSTIRFRQVRPWEKDRPPLRWYTVGVQVTGCS